MPPDINSFSSAQNSSDNHQQPIQSSPGLPIRGRMSDSIRHTSPGNPLRRGSGTTTPPAHQHSPTASSLAAAATLNSSLQNDERNPANGSLRGQPTYERRRSSIRMSLSLNDPALPAPGEMAMSPATSGRAPSWSLHGQQAGIHGSPSPTRHARAPSLGELHQELENEQEAQVNRLLSMIRQQQAQIVALQAHAPASATAAIADDSNPPSDTSRSQTPAQQRIPHQISASRHSSVANPSSQSPSPSLRAQQVPPMALNTSVGDDPSAFGNLPSSAVSMSSNSLRDESAFYQAETQNLTRENQMLKMRIRELERQVTGPESPGAEHAPAHQSHLHTATPVDSNENAVL
ncbi:hypothetical protein BT63DRAFT_427566 [Microthyrium microscopicum]|uniref:Uncharacterized protein n=1 Tax=Microthyrium microscopicum TaxID=703497 RepID=A0A6A6U4U8_9PEZI|nr:hypothetical protein BT63DRAFT_427566 [Microthyrium microscopicum]